MWIGNGTCTHEWTECGSDGALRQAAAWLSRAPRTTIACERYTITSRTAKLTRQPHALEFIGALRSLASDYPSVTFLLQSKSDAIKLGNDGLLRKLGWYTPGAGHANDAARQVLLALAGRHPQLFDELLR